MFIESAPDCGCQGFCDVRACTLGLKSLPMKNMSRRSKIILNSVSRKNVRIKSYLFEELQRPLNNFRL